MALTAARYDSVPTDFDTSRSPVRFQVSSRGRSHVSRAALRSILAGFTKIAIAVIILASVAIAVALPARARNVTASRSIGGDVRDRDDRAPLAGVSIRLQSLDGTSNVTTTSDRYGNFSLPAPEPGRYRLIAQARGYAEASQALSVTVDAVPRPHVVLGRAGLRAIGTATARASEPENAPPGARVSADAFAADERVRVSDRFTTLPGVTVSGDALAPGGDAYVSLRGLRPGESQTLLDGHPIGPIGVAVSAPDADGSVAGFNYQVAPYFALRSADVRFGADASGSFGSGGIGGTVDLRTFDPTLHPQFVLAQGLGTEGRAFSTLRATGRIRNVGYAVAYGVTGTYGLFAPGAIAQTGLRGTDFTSATLRALTYDVSGNYVLRNGLAKLTYAPSANTSIAFSAYDATSWSDKTGEGDNDFNPYAYTLANAPVGATATCPRGVLVTENTGPACISPAQYALSAAGPAGGGPGAWQAYRNSDYDLRITGVAAKNALTLDAFGGTYTFLYHRDASVASGPLDAFLDRWTNAGLRLGTEMATPSNDFTAGVAFLHETFDGNATNAGGSAFSVLAPSGRIDRSAYARDILSPSSRLSLSFDASLKKSTDDPPLRFDPRVSLDYRVARSDALRFVVGHSSAEPSLQTNRVDLLPIGALNPDCGAIARGTASAPADVEVGSAPAPGLAAESASNLEFHYGHEFAGDSAIGVTLYQANVTNRIVTAALPAGTALLPQELTPLRSRIEQFCGLSPAPGNVVFTLGRSFNAATARLRGIELGGRTRLAPHIALEYAYDVQSTVLDDLPGAVLATDPTLVNGAQAFEVPLHKATLGVEFATRGGLRARLEGHAVGSNNPQQLPGYAYADGSLSAAVSKHVSLNATASNVFNSHAQTYGLVGFGVPYATNAYHAAFAEPFVQPFNERYGLAPAAVTLSATLRI
jgi:hypothetical protein